MLAAILGQLVLFKFDNNFVNSIFRLAQTIWQYSHIINN